ncbi:MAG: glycosyltransferase [Candidatus Lokiarchaeota archaeon]|nr:glycosyltransferase [Candidatus Lokiarchaeota archaeon]
MRSINVVFLCNLGSRFPLMIIEGLLKIKNVKVDVSHTFYYLGKPILKNTPFEELKEKLLSCDYIFRSDNQHFVNRKKYDQFIDENKLWKKCVIIDFADSYYIRDKKNYKNCLIYFKRSWLMGCKRKTPPKRKKAFPIQYAILEKYITSIKNYNSKKKYNILYISSKRLKKRMHDFNKGGVYKVLYERFLNSLNEFNSRTINTMRKDIRKRFELKTRRFKTYYELLRSNIPNSLIGANTGGSHMDIFYPANENNKWIEYMKLLKKAKIIFTACPWNHDGDSRTWEAMSSGSLVFMDNTLIPTHPFKDSKHVFYYDASSRKSIKEAIKKAKYYLMPENESERRKIAEKGKEYALKYHMSKNRIKYVFDCIEKFRS